MSMENKVDEIQKDIGEIKVILAEQHVSLKHHIKRTDLLEKKLEPIDTHIKMVNGALKLVGFIGICATIAEAIHQLMR